MLTVSPVEVGPKCTVITYSIWDHIISSPAHPVVTGGISTKISPSEDNADGDKAL
jgi:hypothetical protein